MLGHLLRDNQKDQWKKGEVRNTPSTPAEDKGKRESDDCPERRGHLSCPPPTAQWPTPDPYIIHIPPGLHLQGLISPRPGPRVGTHPADTRQTKAMLPRPTEARRDPLDNQSATHKKEKKRKKMSMYFVCSLLCQERNMPTPSAKKKKRKMLLPGKPANYTQKR